MAHMLVQQQQTHRSPNISIHRSTTSSSPQKDTSLPMAHSVDDRLFLYKHDSTRLLNLLTRFASEPQMSKYHTQTTNSNGHFNKNPVVFALSSSSPTTYLQLHQSEKEQEEVEDHLDDFLNLNCDKIQPVCTSFIEDFNSDKLDNISAISSEQILTELNSKDEFQTPPLNEDILFDTSPNINGNDTQSERHFRRRKRRSSLTRNSLTFDDTQLPQDLISKIDINKEELSLSNEQNDERQNINLTETKIPENEETNEAIMDEEKPASVSRYRGRRLRHRFYLHSAAASSPKEETSDSPVDFYLPNEAQDIETTRIYSPPPSSPVILSPLPSPVSPIPSLISSHQSTNSNTTSGGLKRNNSVGGTKKNVRFADSIGRELTQVQYIRSPTNDESKELSFLIGSSLLSSSPPSFNKNNLYVPSSSRLDHKPWSFDVASTNNKLTADIHLPRRFFCLYRQPDSEHLDIYLHEVWKSQIKLEHADIPINYSSNAGEQPQQLIGTLWVTNASYLKYVSIKYTFNHWLNTCEREAQHRCHSNDFRNLDKFDFSIDIPRDVDRIDFILRYCVNGQEYWDNNEGKNYTLQTESAYTPQTTISLPHDCDFNEMRFY